MRANMTPEQRQHKIDIMTSRYITKGMPLDMARERAMNEVDQDMNPKERFEKFQKEYVAENKKSNIASYRAQKADGLISSCESVMIDEDDVPVLPWH